MIETVYLVRNTGTAQALGGLPFSLGLRLDDTLDLSVGFLDAAGKVIALPAGATGSMILKPLDGFTNDPRLLVPSWSVSGEAASRRYKFKAVVDSDLLRSDMNGLSTKSYALQIRYVVDGDPFVSADIPVTITGTYFASGDVPPSLPVGGIDSVEWGQEVWGETELVATGTRWAGRINRGGSIYNLRLSTKEWHADTTVQVKVNGVDLLATAVELAAETTVLSAVDHPELFNALTIAAGAKIELVATFTGAEYADKCRALRIDIALRSRAESESWIGLIGDGAETELVVEHGLNAESLLIVLRVAGDGGRYLVQPQDYQAEHTDANTLTITVDESAYGIPDEDALHLSLFRLA